MTAARLFHSLLPQRVCLLLPQRSLPSLIHQGEIRCVSTTSHYQGVKTMCRASAPLSTFKSNHAFARPQWQHKQISEMCTLSSNRKSRPRKRRWGPSKPKQTKGPPKELDSFTAGMLGQKEGRVLFPAGYEIGGGYTVVEHIGRGAFGEVYHAVHEASGEHVAVKMEPSNKSLPLLPNEAKAYRALEGVVGVPKLHWVGKADDLHHAIAMDLLGPSLRELHKALGQRFSLATVSQLGLQTLDIVEQIHQRRFLYCDLKPANLVLPRPDAQVSDELLARAWSAPEASTDELGHRRLSMASASTSRPASIRATTGNEHTPLPSELAADTGSGAPGGDGAKAMYASATTGGLSDATAGTPLETSVSSDADAGGAAAAQKAAKRTLIEEQLRSLPLRLIDFGFARQFVDPRTGCHLPPIKRRGVVGTARYASLTNHQGMPLGRRDDLEALALMLIFLRHGTLPWTGVKETNKALRFAAILAIKEATPIETICDRMPEPFSEYLRYVRKLRYDQRPDYALLRALLREAASQPLN